VVDFIVAECLPLQRRPSFAEVEDVKAYARKRGMTDLLSIRSPRGAIG
jgi:hypothetical protein